MDEPEAISEVRREIMLAEYKSLRDETFKRMDHRITLFVSSLTISGAIAAIAVERRSGALLLLTPIFATLFGLMVLFHTKIIADIARYVVEKIELPLNEAYPNSIGWHIKPAWKGSKFRGILITFHVPMMLTVAVPALVTVALSWQYGDPPEILVPLMITDLGLVAFYFWQYFRSVQPIWK